MDYNHYTLHFPPKQGEILNKEFFHKGVEIGGIYCYNMGKAAVSDGDAAMGKELISLKQRNNLYLVAGTAGLGAAGCALRTALYAVGVDNRGFLVRLHPLELVLWIVTGLTAVLIAMQVCAAAPQKPRGKAVLVAAACASFLAAAGILWTVLRYEPLMPNYPGIVWKLFGYVSAICLLGTGVLYLTGKKPRFWMYLMVSAFFLMYMVDHYRSWSGHPQLMDFLFSVLAMAALTLYAYYCAAWEVGLGKGKMRLATGLAAVFLCITALSAGAYLLLYGSSAIWAGATVLLWEPEEKQEILKEETERKQKP